VIREDQSDDDPGGGQCDEPSTEGTGELHDALDRQVGGAGLFGSELNSRPRTSNGRPRTPGSSALRTRPIGPRYSGRLILVSAVAQVRH
jgi:hypothetical protein